jgi:hypothetical protein
MGEQDPFLPSLYAPATDPSRHFGRTGCEERVSSSAVACEVTYARTMLVFRRATPQPWPFLGNTDVWLVGGDVSLHATRRSERAQQRDPRH